MQYLASGAAVSRALFMVLVALLFLSITATKTIRYTHQKIEEHTGQTT